jgi:hypothetical protein
VQPPPPLLLLLLLLLPLPPLLLPLPPLRPEAVPPSTVRTSVSTTATPLRSGVAGSQ